MTFESWLILRWLSAIQGIGDIRRERVRQEYPDLTKDQLNEVAGFRTARDIEELIKAFDRKLRDANRGDPTRL